MKSYTFKNEDSFVDFMETPNREIYYTIWKSIDYAYSTKKNLAYVAEVFIEEEDKTLDLIVNQIEWENSLNLALKFFEKEEEYEMCIKIKKLIERCLSKDIS